MRWTVLRGHRLFRRGNDPGFRKAKQLGLPVKLHAEQLSNLGGTALAASYGALSADHLEYLDEAGAKALVTAGTVAVLLPGAFTHSGKNRLLRFRPCAMRAPISHLRPIAIPAPRRSHPCC